MVILYNIKLALILSRSFRTSLTFLDILLASIRESIIRVIRSKEEGGLEVVIGQEFDSFFRGKVKRTRLGFHGYKPVWYYLLLILLLLKANS